jgi:phage tail-like protein
MTSEVRSTLPPFARLNARTGWPLGEASSRPGIVSLNGALKLATAGAAAIAMNEPFGSFGGKRLPRGVAVSATGRIFVADRVARVIWTAQASSHEGPAVIAPLWPARPLPPAPTPKDVVPPPKIPADPYTLVSPTDLAFLPNGDLAIADPGAARVLVIAFPTGQLRQVIDIRNGTPTALAVDAKGRTYIADPANKTIHRYDAIWRRDKTFPRASAALVRPEYLAVPLETPGESCICGCGGLCGDEASPHHAAIHVLDDGKLIGLDERGYRVALTDIASLRLAPPALGKGENGTLLYVDPAMPGREPVQLTGLALFGDGSLDPQGVPLLAMPKRVQVPRSGGFVTTALDSGRAGFAWDRLVFVCSFPDNTRLLVQTLTSDSAIEFDRVLKVPDEDWSAPLTLTKGLAPEVLVQSEVGRYLWLKVSLFGDGNSSPVIDEIEVYGPRRSAMRYLPASYHQDRESVSFLDRYLSYFDTVFGEISASNRDIAALFDPLAVPEGEFLDWLGSWFDWAFLAEWDARTRREMIAEAVHYYSIRGTIAGLKKILQWHTGLADPMPQIIEHFRFAPNPPPDIGGTPIIVTTAAHSATIVLPRSAVPDSAAEARILKLISKNAPAHVEIGLRLFEPGITIGSQSTIGVDMLIGSLAPKGLGEAQFGLDFSTDAPLQRGVATLRSAAHERNLSC